MASKVFRPSLLYWDRRSVDEQAEQGRVGTVVVLGWMLSRQKHLAPYARFYKSCGWDSLICHPQLFNLFFPSRATTLALNVLDELAKDLEEHPGPVVFAVFSGGHKACLYKIIQILLGDCAGVNVDAGRYALVRRSLAGLVFDSSPVDFVSDLGAKFVSHQVLTLQPGRPIALVSWGASAVGKTLDALFGGHLEPQRIDLWRTLYSSVNIGPILFLCSENDKLAPVETVYLFASNLRKLGGNVYVVSWKESEHVGHFRLYPEEYMNAVRKLLGEAASLYSGRLERIINHDSSISPETIGSMGDLQASLDRPAASWTVLPETTAIEIRRVSRLPHVHYGKEDIDFKQKDLASRSYNGLELQPSSEPQDVKDWDVQPSHCEEQMESYGSIKSESLPHTDKCFSLRSRL